MAESELEQNYFGILTLDGTAGAKLDYQAAYFSRYYRLNFDPDPVGDLIFNGIAARLMHSGLVNGIQADTTYRWKAEHVLGAGIYVSGETIELDDHAQVASLDSCRRDPVPRDVRDLCRKSTSPISVVDDNHQRVRSRLRDSQRNRYRSVFAAMGAAARSLCGAAAISTVSWLRERVIAVVCTPFLTP